MSGELQTIPARHGVATFVPRGRTIKVINTYGQQVISMWAFTLGAPPEEEEMNEKDAAQQEAEDLEQNSGEDSKKSAYRLKNDTKKISDEEKTEITAEEKVVSKEETPKEDVAKIEASTDDASKEEISKEGEVKEETKDAPSQAETSASSPTNPRSKRTWASYLPSIPYRSKGKTNESSTEPKVDTEAEKAQNEAKTKKWSSYLPTGQGFSSYVPNVDSTSIVSAFKSSHYRDPNKSYAEQLYDFSKTPVGAGTIAAATGSGYASSVYAVYNAYSQLNPNKTPLAAMEYLSLPHTRASSHKLVPSVDDTLLTNLRNPIVTLIEDTTPGAHDTLTAACDANLYATLGVDTPAEHGSCAENLVLALKEMNEKSGLTGAKAVGADISVNIAPTPLHLFMNAPLEVPASGQTTSGTGAKGATLSVAAPTAKKRSFVRFRAERDVVVVFSACPMDVGPQNGGRCMAANFMVEDAEGEDLAASNADVKVKKDGGDVESKSGGKAGKKSSVDVVGETKKQAEKEVEVGTETETKDNLEGKDPTPGKENDNADTKSEEVPQAADNTNTNTIAEDETKPTESKPKKKPKKLEVRSGGTSTPAKSFS